ncbi:hypothetical protein CHS0354_010762 [Potamilus streckersoni]|uniref:Uncharacterized protein n=1 Tax=Potamilus streckersoni TaxID=2493646 RepID=A0AAE0W8M0_9BIVA|nr:hypothetical protein CHS0354_010762 [Potamilus streckersoni]
MCKMSLKCIILHVTDAKSLEADSTWTCTIIKSRRILIIQTKDFFQCTSSVRDLIQKYRYKLFCLHLPKILTGIVEDTSKNTFHSGECLKYPESQNDLHIKRFWKVFEMLLPKKHDNSAIN